MCSAARARAPPTRKWTQLQLPGDRNAAHCTLQTLQPPDPLYRTQYLINIIRKRKRFSKWVKPELEHDLESVKEYYGYSNEKARQALSILSKEDLEQIKSKVDKGGRN